MAGEIERGHLRVLNELAQERGPLISDAIRRSARARREAAMVTVDRLFALLELRPRVPVQLLADVIVAFIDGLAIHASLAPDANHRVAFDVLWLSLSVLPNDVDTSQAATLDIADARALSPRCLGA